MNNKILTTILVLGIVSTGFAGISSAKSGTNNGELKTGLEQGIKKITQKGNHFGKRKGLKDLTDEEKELLSSMSTEEKKTFFESKKTEKKSQKDAGKAVVDKLLKGESLTAAEETIRGELLIKIEEGNHKRSNADIIAKILAGDELSEAELTELTEMQEKHTQREARRVILEPIRDKVNMGEALSDEEQSILDEEKSQKKGKRGGKYKDL